MGKENYSYVNPSVRVRLRFHLTGHDSYSAHQLNKFPVKQTVTKYCLQLASSIPSGVVGVRSACWCSPLVGKESGGRKIFFFPGTHRNQFVGFK